MVMKVSEYWQKFSGLVQDKNDAFGVLKAEGPAGDIVSASEKFRDSALAINSLFVETKTLEKDGEEVKKNGQSLFAFQITRDTIGKQIKEVLGQVDSIPEIVAKNLRSVQTGLHLTH